MLLDPVHELVEQDVGRVHRACAAAAMAHAGHAVELGHLAHRSHPADLGRGVVVILLHLSVDAAGVADAVPHQHLVAALFQAAQIGAVGIAIVDPLRRGEPGVDLGLVVEVQVLQRVEVVTVVDLGQRTADHIAGGGLHDVLVGRRVRPGRRNRA